MPVTVSTLREMKQQGRKITMVTAYDYPSARLVEAAGIEMILVGDSVGNTVLGHATTVPVRLEDILHHARAVTRAVSTCLVVADLPFMTYHISVEETMRAAARLLQEGGAHAVKLEGGQAVVGTVRRLVDAGVPVLGHLGLTPQSVLAMGGYRLQATTPAAADRLIADAEALEAAGACAIVLEVVPASLATLISRRLSIPTIGIGAGPGCDGQVQVWHDLLGLGGERVGRHARRYADLGALIQAALAAYRDDVRGGAFPAAEQSFNGPAELRAYLAERAAGEG
jgi:3-methyl-2-oxobutanoate hydroxymethyltransferase